jgi:hypothetical protein
MENFTRREALTVAATAAAGAAVTSGAEAQTTTPSGQISPEVAKSFFKGLYEELPKIPNTPQFDLMTTRIVTQLGGTVSTGDQALQGLMFNYILASPDRAAAGQRLGAVLGNIKQAAVMEFAKTFPNANLDELVAAAKKAGYDVEVLKK